MGRPGVGKTTLIQEVVKGLQGSAGGFYTAEIREGGKRRGFKIITLDGREGILAHDTIKGPTRVGRYGVSLHDLEDIGVKAIEQAVRRYDYIVIDEIGKMELASPRFQKEVKDALNSEKTVMATVMATPHPFVDSLKGGSRVTVVEVTLANRNRLKDRILKMLQE